MEKSQIVTYWLCPAEPARSYFAALIGDLARRFDAPIFEPHVTLYSTDAKRENPESVLAAVVKGARKYHLAIRGLDYSDEFTKTFFVQLEPSSQVTQLSADLKRASASRAEYELNPHLSLLYQKMDRATKQQLASSTALSFNEVTFDRVKAVIVPAEIESRQDVESWQVVAEKSVLE